jgi:hypothetical protein
MRSPIRISTTIQSGHKIEATAPQFHEGDAVEMLLFVALREKSAKTSALSIIESLRGHRLFQTPEEVD